MTYPTGEKCGTSATSPIALLPEEEYQEILDFLSIMGVYTALDYLVDILTEEQLQSIIKDWREMKQEAS